jgi:hypothetical protein
MTDVNYYNAKAHIHGVLCAMAEHMRSTIGIGVLVETIYSERTTRLPSTRCLIKVPRKLRLDDSNKRRGIDLLARYLRHAGFIDINRLFFARATIRKEMRRWCDKPRWCSTKGTTLDRTRKDDIG